MPGRVRVTGGELRGRLVTVPGTARPTEGRVREALFSIWARELPGSRFLDLFAGSGVVAIEAASRGALSVIAVESDPKACRQLEANLRHLGLSGVVEPWQGALPAQLTERRDQEGRSIHLIFADPPYAFEGYRELLAAAEPLLAEDGRIAIEHSARVELPSEVACGSRPLVRAEVRRYGESALSFYCRLACC